MDYKDLKNLKTYQVTSQFQIRVKDIKIKDEFKNLSSYQSIMMIKKKSSQNIYLKTYQVTSQFSQLLNFAKSMYI